ncbi:hypothetical protein K1T71_011702 [Dendrolimus kikuchii]|uniref:Uncharacterized protein n=1 Tax=Dendrolimus kikuchii TaxID=765133 RepID=A0ACC1CLU9_9NEOP|nr:hypothetical protein K1T71_011702 [Dendrolimus kikuchii]
MSRRVSNVDQTYIDTQYSSGDSKAMKSIQNYKEENNNEIDELSKNFNDMGCIVDAVKRPPNICVENCVYESDFDENSYKEEDAYSDEFEEDKSESDPEEVLVETTDETKAQSAKSESVDTAQSSSVKLSKSQSSIISNKMSVSGRTDYGSVSVPPTRRINMSFTNERLREIERHNHILLTKILSARNKKKSSIPARDQQPVRKPQPPAAAMRRNQQRKIDHDNMILLKKIQGAKSSACSIRR